jgi:hypothetical protein
MLYMSYLYVKKVMERYYVYEHIKLDTNTVFYVGYSKISNTGLIYSRAYRSPYRRTSKNGIWEQYVINIQYVVRIVEEFSTKEEALALEVKLIQHYGRLDLETGDLINQNDGGQGMRNPSPDLKKVISQNRSKAFNKDVLRKAQLPYLHITHKYDVLGNYIQSYDCIADAARDNNTLPSDLSLIHI